MTCSVSVVVDELNLEDLVRRGKRRNGREDAQVMDFFFFLVGGDGYLVRLSRKKKDWWRSAEGLISYLPAGILVGQACSMGNNRETMFTFHGPCPLWNVRKVFVRLDFLHVQRVLCTFQFYKLPLLPIPLHST